MMTFTTPIEIPAGLPRLSHTDRLLLMGSCFATEMGVRLVDAKFRCDVNPFGVLYNPCSLSAALRRMGEGSAYTETELFFHNGLFHSPMHHGDFSAATAAEALARINERLMAAHEAMPELNVLFLTWGTAWVYEERVNGTVVGNCHKLPERHFLRRKLRVEEIVEEYSTLLPILFSTNPGLKLLLTVSPIRHLRDGLHENQLSKATLLLAADELQRRFPANVFYFPAYEILLDELRDYRFYADDMLHPSKVAVEYIWSRFTDACLTSDAKEVLAACGEIQKMLAHKPFHPESSEYKCFLEQIVLKIDQLSRKYPYLALENERALCHIRLNTSRR